MAKPTQVASREKHAAPVVWQVPTFMDGPRLHKATPYSPRFDTTRPGEKSRTTFTKAGWIWIIER